MGVEGRVRGEVRVQGYVRALLCVGHVAATLSCCYVVTAASQGWPSPCRSTHAIFPSSKQLHRSTTHAFKVRCVLHGLRGACSCTLFRVCTPSASLTADCHANAMESHYSSVVQLAMGPGVFEQA
jgi:hypothetical protein